MAWDAHVENIVDDLEPIALIIRADFDAHGVQFFTPDSFCQQVAHMGHPKGKAIAPHVHNVVPRQVSYTHEVILIRRGRVEVDLYRNNRSFLTSRTLAAGDLILLCGGGHSFRMLEDTSMIEIKQGPYVGERDKTRFEPHGDNDDPCK